MAAENLVERSQRLLGLVCADPGGGPRGEACRSLAGGFDAALRDLQTGEATDAMRVLEELVRQASAAAASGALNADEEALIAGGVRKIIERLE